MFSVGIEARGFFFGPSIALAIGAKFIPLRKPRKLPGIALQIFSSLQFKKVLFMQLMHTSMIYHMNDLYLRTWNWLLLYLHGIPYFLLPCPLTYVGLSLINVWILSPCMYSRLQFSFSCVHFSWVVCRIFLHYRIFMN